MPVEKAVLEILKGIANFRSWKPPYLRKTQLIDTSSVAKMIASSPPYLMKAKKIIVSAKLKYEFEWGKESVSRDVIKSAAIINITVPTLKIDVLRLTIANMKEARPHAAMTPT